MDSLIKMFRDTLDKNGIRMTVIWGSLFWASLVSFIFLLTALCLRIFWYDWRQVFLSESDKLITLGTPLLVIAVCLFPLFRLWRAESQIAKFFRGRWAKTYWDAGTIRPDGPNEHFVIRNGNEYWRAPIVVGDVGDLSIVYFIQNFRKRWKTVTFTLAGAPGELAAKNPNRDVQLASRPDGSWEGTESGDKKFRVTNVCFSPINEISGPDEK